MINIRQCLPSEEVNLRDVVGQAAAFLKNPVSAYAVETSHCSYLWTSYEDARECPTVWDAPQQEKFTPSVLHFREKDEITFCSPMANLSWLAEFYEEADEAKTSIDIYPLISGISDLFSDKDYLSVDNILSSAPLDKLSVTAMVALIRTTYPAKSKLSHWDESLEAVRSKLASIGENHQSLLRGLA